MCVDYLIALREELTVRCLLTFSEADYAVWWRSVWSWQYAVWWHLVKNWQYTDGIPWRADSTLFDAS